MAEFLGGFIMRTLGLPTNELRGPFKGRWNVDAYGVSLILAVITLGTYYALPHCGFINYDDQFYISDNPYVNSGLTLRSIEWAFTSMAGFYQPLTWLSLMLDVELFSANPGTMHVTNLLIHVANVILVFLVLKEATGAPSLSALAALLFAVSPVNVETVAWLSERKGLLAMLFALLSMYYYLLHWKWNTRWHYHASIAAFLLSLLSKPVALTLPFAVLLIDRCLALASPLTSRRGRGAIIGNWPFLAISLLAGVLTLKAEFNVGAVYTSTTSVLDNPLSRSASSAWHYIERCAMPFDYALVKPRLHGSEGPLAIGWVTCLALITLCSLRVSSRLPHFTCGWFFYLVTLVPVCGVIEVGNAQVADRYAYMPLLGVYVSFVWLVNYLLKRLQYSVLITCVALYATVSFCLSSNWTDSERVWSCTIRNTSKNYIAMNNLASHYYNNGQYILAARWYRQAVAANPEDSMIWTNLAMCYSKLRASETAKSYLSKALSVNADDRKAALLLGHLLACDANPLVRNPSAALDILQMAIVSIGSSPDLIWLAECYNSTAAAYASLGLYNDAVASQEVALGIRTRIGGNCDNYREKLGYYKCIVHYSLHHM